MITIESLSKKYGAQHRRRRRHASLPGPAG